MLLNFHPPLFSSQPTSKIFIIMLTLSIFFILTAWLPHCPRCLSSVFEWISCPPSVSFLCPGVFEFVFPHSTWLTGFIIKDDGISSIFAESPHLGIAFCFVYVHKRQLGGIKFGFHTLFSSQNKMRLKVCSHCNTVTRH